MLYVRQKILKVSKRLIDLTGSNKVPTLDECLWKKVRPPLVGRKKSPKGGGAKRECQ